MGAGPGQIVGRTTLLAPVRCATITGPFESMATRGRADVPLSEDEQRILSEIEQQFHAHDPDLANDIENHTVYAHYWRFMKWAAAGFLMGVVVLMVALFTESSFVVAFAGFVAMLACALWFERSLRKLGRAGFDQLTQSMRASGLRDSLGSASQRMRDRFRKEDE